MVPYVRFVICSNKAFQPAVGPMSNDAVALKVTVHRLRTKKEMNLPAASRGAPLKVKFILSQQAAGN
jgi:hypothetical protein